MADQVTGLPLIKAFKSEVFPLDRIDPGSDLGVLLSRILVTEWHEELYSPGPGGRFEIGLTIAEEAVLDLVGLEGFALVFGGASATTLRVGFGFTPGGWEVSIGAGARLRFPRTILKPVVRSSEAWVEDSSRAFAELEISAGIIIDHNWDVDFDGGDAFTLAPAMVADSGLVIEGQVALDLSETRGLPESAAQGLPPSWKGVVFRSLKVHLPDAVSQVVPISNLALTDFHIGTGGVSGSIALTGTPGPGALGGFPFQPTRLAVELRQNCLVGAEIGGRLTLAFFDEPITVTAGFDLAGNFTVAVDAPLVELTKPDVLTLAVDGLRFAVENGVFLVGVSGKLTPLIGGLDWPSFTVRELSVDSTGNVRLEGGWLDLSDHYSLDFYGFHVGISRLGMGSGDDGGRWIGFSGDVKLVDGLSIGGSVDGLRVTWYDDGRPARLTMDGVGVELEIPDVLRFKGFVGYHELPGPQRRFDGDITLELLALDLRIDGKIVIGRATDAGGHEYTFFALYIGVELPAGIPLWATGLGLYGVAGLVAIEMAPNKGAPPNALHPQSRPDEEWFENLDGSPGWYKRPATGVTELRSKWDPEPGGFALGGGVTIGTLADNGFVFNGSLLLVISFPGPVILLEGKANLLKQRSTLSDDPLFRALVVLDFRAGNALVGLDARYKVGDGGELIEISGSAEAFFDFADASRWHLYLGRSEPRERRIRAQILSLFEANAYFMIDANSLRTGAWVGYDKQWNFGPLSVVIEAWIEGGVALSWKPVYFHGEIWLHGKVELRVFGFGLGLHADARFACDVFDPFHVVAELSVGIVLPWPLPDFEVDITLEWGPTPKEPPLPLPLKEIAVEHFKTSVGWPLPRGSLLVPAVDAGDGFLAIPPPAPDLAAPAPAGAPVVPLDARPHLTFGRAVHDDALIGVNPQPVLPSAAPPGWARVGDPAAQQGPMRIRYALTEVTLARWNGAGWDTIARKAATPNPAGVKELFGSWAPMPQLPSGAVAPGTDPPVAQVKLWLWSKSPFDFSAHGGSAWDEWFTDTFPGYPCVPPARPRVICCDFDDTPAGTVVRLPRPCRRHPEVVFTGTAEAVVEALPAPVRGHAHALCWTGETRREAFGIVLTGPPAERMTLVFAEAGTEEERCLVVDELGREILAAGRIALPFAHEGTRIRLLEYDDSEAAETPVREAGGAYGIDLRRHAEIDLPCAAVRVEITLWQGAAPARVTGLDQAGAVVASAAAPQRQGVVTFALRAPGGATISRVLIEAPQGETHLLRLCSTCQVSGTAGVQVTAVDAVGGHSGPYLPAGDTVTVEVKDLRGVQVHARGRVCLVQVCVTYAPSQAELAARQDMARRLQDAMTLWGGEGEVLRPHSDYRIAVATKVQAVGEDALAGVNRTYDVTEVAYFRTAGPPALTTLSTPVGHPPQETFDSGLDDLTRYVRQTVPPTVPERGERPLLPRPVYRGYDVGVEFNEDYVDLMYRLAGRDLALILVDAGNTPVRDVRGRIVVGVNRWGQAGTATLAESTVRYLTLLDQASCVMSDPAIIPRDRTVRAAAPGQVLDPDRLHEARLVPLLLHEDFRDGLSGWTVADTGANQTPSAWAALGHPTLEGDGATAAGAVVTVPGTADLSAVDPSTDVVVLTTDTAWPDKTYRVLSVDVATRRLTVDGSPALFSGASHWRIPGWGAVRQTSNIWGGDDSAEAVPKPGTTLVGGDAAWTEYRAHVLLRSGDDDAIGVAFRWNGPGDHYRFSMDRERGYRRLVRVAGGVYTVLAEDEETYLLNRDYLVTVEAIGPSLRVFVDGEPVFAVTDRTFTGGRIGLYCWANESARFSDVRVEDFGSRQPVAYRFAFTTSAFVDVAHHLHSFDDRIWAAAGGGAVAAAAGSAVAPGVSVGDAETRAFATLAAAVLGAAAQRPAARLEAHRIGADAFLVRGPEPIDWARTELRVLRADGIVPAPEPPENFKIIEVVADGSSPNDETITVLARDRATPAGLRLETYGVPDPLPDPPSAVLLHDDFDTPGGVLLRERFGGNALDAYRIVDASPATEGPSQWAVAGGAIVQTSNIWAGGDFYGADPAKPGTVAVTGGLWGGIRLTAVLRSGDDDAIGVVFRYADDANWYRFSMDRERPYRRLVKCVRGTVTTLWEDAAGYDQNRAYEVRIDAFGDLILGYLDHMLLFVVLDGSIPAGQVGFYCFANVGARFEAMRVEELAESPVLFRSGPGPWDGTPVFDDAEISVRVRPAGMDAAGLEFRLAGDGSGYRFTLDGGAGRRRLTRTLAGVETLLWQGSFTPSGGTYAITVRMEGERIRIWADGAALLDLIDPAVAAGRVGPFTAVPGGADFGELLVAGVRRRVGGWEIVDASPDGGPSAWTARSGALRQTTASGTAVQPAAPGTLAVNGSATWADVRIVVRMRTDADTAAGVVFRYTSPGDWYRLSFNAQAGYRRLDVCAGGVVSTLWADAQAYPVGPAFTVTVDAVGTRLVGRLGDTVLFDVVDATHPAGRVGLYTCVNDKARFERVTVTIPPQSAYADFSDGFAVGDVSGWTFTDPPSSLSGPSNWAISDGWLTQTGNIYTNPVIASDIAKPGAQAVAGDPAWTDVIWTVRVRSDDDDAIGVLFRHTLSGDHYRFSMDAERGYRRLVSCSGGVYTLLWEDQAGYEPGRAYQVTIASIGARHRIWLDGIPVLEVEDATHPAGRVGLYCWADDGARFAGVRVFTSPAIVPLFDETFAAVAPGRWGIVTAGDQQGPAEWAVTGGELVQSSNAWGGDPDPAALDKPGTTAILTLPEGLGPTGLIPGSLSWTDYRLTVRLRSDDDDAIGVLFRYTDPGNWYRFSMDRERSYRRLVRCSAGAYTELWSDTTPYATGRDHLITIDAVADGIVGYVNGVEVFSVRDSTHPAGTVGLYAWANTGARFSSVTVTGAAWSPVYVFAPDEPVAEAGTKLVVHSGSPSSWSASPVPGVEHRFLAAFQDQGHTRLPADRPSDIRLLTPAGATAHARRFLPGSAYAPVNARLLRKADGTEFALFAESPLPPGQYRLQFAYRRDNTAAIPSSLVLSRAGDTSPEHVTLDIPWS